MKTLNMKTYKYKCEYCDFRTNRKTVYLNHKLRHKLWKIKK